MKTTVKNIQLNPELWSVNHKDYLTVMARRKLPDHLVDDIVQDTFLAALQAAPRFKGHATERVWLTAILKNKIIDHYRRVYSKKGKVWHNALRVSDSESWKDFEKESKGSEYNNTTALIYADELQKVLDSGLELLCKQEQKVLRMKIKGYSTEDICKTLGINKGNSWVSLSRARKKIKHYLNDHWYDVA